MPNGMATTRGRPIGWPGIAIGAGLTLAFTFVAGLIATALRAPMVAVLLSAVALALAGFATMRLRPVANPLDPAIGAAIATLAINLAQIAMLRERMPAATAAEIGISVVISVVLAFLLAWLGARLATRTGSRPTPPHDRPISP